MEKNIDLSTTSKNESAMIKRGGGYPGDDDDEEADGDKAKVGDQPIVE